MSTFRLRMHAALVASSLACAGPALAQDGNNVLSAKEQAEGWQLLFDGHSLAGWHSFQQKAPGKDWKVKDGTILLERGRRGDSEDFQDLTTDAEYADFDLKLEWKMSPCADSGVFFYVDEASKHRNAYDTGPEMQIADLACTEPDSRVLNERSGDLFDLISSDVEWVREAGNWNQFEIIAQRGHVQFFQNGHKVVDFQLGDERWKQRVAGSKFAAMADFAKARSGHIALQGTEDKGRTPIQLAFRNIKLRKL